ncbi:uncharacterized protein LOC130957252 [Arachis stenosperma]|uniref:uncharacterized protein LOC130957252 n=1 Tax=Arachis stenosperma TaxID=217475 RepID=UPI0025ACF13D|nr:uncharacterized protein LOC130957252 [Arachis stenosperma]
MEKNQVAAITTQPSTQEGVNTEEGGEWEQANYVGNSPRQNHDLYSKTYNSGWKNHPNFGWENQQEQSQNQTRQNHNPNNHAVHQHSSQRSYQQPPNHTPQHPYQNQHDHPHSYNPNPSYFEDRLSRIETLLEGLCKEVKDSKLFQEEVRSNMQNQDAAIKKLEVQIGYLFKQIPSQTNCRNINPNPREECQAITLRSGKELKETSKIPSAENSDKREIEQKEDQVIPPNTHREEEVLRSYPPKAPYPQQLKKKEDDSQFSRFLKIFKRLQINIPFAEAIEQMPLYAKFLKELMTKKRSWRNNETVVLTEECSAII